jgi:hypothetical protein
MFKPRLILAALSMLLMGVLFSAPLFGQIQVQVNVPMPVAPGIAPQWTPVPGAPGIHYAPNIASDLFRYGNGYYYQNQGAWYQGPSIRGPWTPSPQIPQPFYQVQAPYFKSPPGWAKGRKTGWGGAPMPPGQMKKMEGGKVPPGQMKKYGY